MSAQLSMFAAVSERDRILAAMAANHRVYLESLRAFAREIALRHGEVCIDDVRAELGRRGYPMPRDIGADERLFGVVFRCKDFCAVGMRTTSRAAWAARIGRSRDCVMVYRLCEQVAA